MQEFWPRIANQTCHLVSNILRDLRKKPRSFHGRARRSGVENLEGRTLLTALVPPTVSTTSFAATGTVAQNATSLTVTFSETVNGANVSGNYVLQRTGTDGILGTADDVSVAITSASVSGNVATLNFAALATPDLYRVTVKDTIQDTFSHYLDGDSNGVIGGNNVRSFTVGSPSKVAAWGSGSGATPTFQITNTDFLSIAQGNSHTLGLKADGTVWAWGENGYGQLGNGTTTASSIPVQVLGLTSVTAIATVSDHNLALLANGTVRSWGLNGNSQLGEGTTINRTTPVEVSGLSGVTAIAAGYYHSVALRSDGTLRSWGWNGHGQLGDGTTSNRTTPVAVSGLSSVTAIAAGISHNMALRTDGTVHSWGYNNDGELGDGTTASRFTPVMVNGLSGVTAITAGDGHCLALRSDGTVRSWGWNFKGQLGDGTTSNRLTPVAVTGLTGVTAIDAGGLHSVALRSDGTVRSWGRNLEGQLGDGTTTDRLTPVTVTGLTSVTVISAGLYKTAALRAPLMQSLPVVEFSVPTASGIEGSIASAPRLLVNGTVVGGQTVDVTVTGGSATLGTDFTLTTTIAIPAGTYDGTAGTSIEIPLAILSDFDSESTEDIQLTLLHPTTGISLGDSNGNATAQVTHTYTIADVVDTTSPTVTSTSFSGTGTAAINSTSLKVDFSETVTGANVPENYELRRAGTDGILGTADDVTVPITSASVSIGTATLNFAALPTDMYRLTVKDAITDTVGQFLDGDSNSILGGNNVRSFTVGTPTKVAIWGETYSSTPTFPIANIDFVSIAQGASHTLGLKADGTVWAWGGNAYGQLGNGTTTASSTPVQVAGLTNVTAVSTVANSSMALLSDGTVRSWGFNGEGQLGDGTFINRQTTVAVPGLSGVSAIVASFNHSMALLSNGTVRTWGLGTNGQLGNGTTTSSSIPVAVSSLSSVRAISAGAYHSQSAAAYLGTVRTWGLNSSGELGDGTTTQRATLGLRVRADRSNGDFIGQFQWIRAALGRDGPQLGL
ncbi:MAG: Ig-like domain-containing protein [Planctomycetaceae bacterium]